jgi:hypothetical protein
MVSKEAGIGPEDVDVVQLQDPAHPPAVVVLT